jgi:hypothetical protein
MDCLHHVFCSCYYPAGGGVQLILAVLLPVCGLLNSRPEVRDDSGSQMFHFLVIIILMGQPNKSWVNSEQFPISFSSVTTGSFTFFDLSAFQTTGTLLTIMKQMMIGYGI